MRIQTLFVVVALVLLPAFTEADIEKARQAAQSYKQKYWECLAAEIVRMVPTTVSAQDFSLLLQGACPTEKQNFRVPFVDYFAMKFPDVGVQAQLSQFEIVAKAAQDDALRGFINLRSR